MKQFAKIFTIALVAIGAAYGGVISTIGENPGAQLDVIGVTGFMTTGADMGGLSVNVTFGISGTQSCVWAATGATSGGCSVPGFFDINQDGDTFNDGNPWVLTNLTTFDSISLLVLDGTPARLSDSGTIFDRTFGGVFGTLGSARGKDANGTTSDLSNGSALYQNLVAVMPALPVGDVFTTLEIRFDGNGLGFGQNATFVADTDTIGIFIIPEPGTIALLGAGLVGLALRRRYAGR